MAKPEPGPDDKSDGEEMNEDDSKNMDKTVNKDESEQANGEEDFDNLSTFL